MVRTILEDVLTGVKDTTKPAACKWMWMTNVALRAWRIQHRILRKFERIAGKSPLSVRLRET